MNHILNCAKLCSAIYKSKFISQRDMELSQYHTVVNLREKGKIWIFPFTVEASIVWDDVSNICYVVYQGSWSIYDWISNIAFNLSQVKPYASMDESSKVKVHYGFLSQYKAIRGQIRTELYKLSSIMGKPDHIYFTGHSLGGALASLHALDFQFKGFTTSENISVATFGCPMIGNAEFVESFNKRIPLNYRYVNGDDYITKLPPKIFGYKHTGTKTQIGKSHFPWISFVDHHPEKYVKSLES
jgi:triacylglycerol lipase